jgi:hypothetical protein
MTQRIVTLPDVILIAGTRVGLGAGIGLLLSRRLRDGVRIGAGWALLAMGVLTTIPLVMKFRAAHHAGELEQEAGRPWAQRQTPASTAVHSPS